jgi:hypothetical protein
MTEKKRFLLRLDSDLYAMLEKWAADDLRSVNAQIEYLLTEAGRKAGRARVRLEGGRSTDRGAGQDREVRE